MTTLWFPHSFPAKGEKGVFSLLSGAADALVVRVGLRAHQEGMVVLLVLLSESKTNIKTSPYARV
jgi:hypothetical protein